MTRIYLLLVFMGISLSIFAQSDLVFLMKGKKLPISSYQMIDVVNGDTILNLVLENGRNKKFYQDEIFSIIKKDGSEKILYHPDPMNGELLKTAQMKSYVNGIYDARKVKVSPLITVGGIGAGFIGALIPSPEMELGGSSKEMPAGALLPITYSILAGSIDSPGSKLKKTFPDKFTDEYYIMGCNETLRKKRFRNSIIGSIIGFTAGAILLSTTN